MFEKIFLQINKKIARRPCEHYSNIYVNSVPRRREATRQSIWNDLHLYRGYLTKRMQVTCFTLFPRDSQYGTIHVAVATASLYLPFQLQRIEKPRRRTDRIVWNTLPALSKSCCTSSSLERPFHNTMPLVLKDIALYFDQPLEVAAKKLNVCIATLKRACREYKIKRWPYRALRAVRKRSLDLRGGCHLTPSEVSTLHRCERALADLRTTALSDLHMVPAIDNLAKARAQIAFSTGETHSPLSKTMCPPARCLPSLPRWSGDEFRPKPVELLVTAPALEIERQLRKLVASAFLPL